MKISILGATGAMGGFVIKAALQEGYLVINKISSKDNIEKLFINTDVIIDFSCPLATECMLRYIIKKRIDIPIVIGTTGLSNMHRELILQCSASIPIFYSTNMSFLISILNVMIYGISKLLGEEFDVEILDRHHKLKKDAPSGTALMFGKTIAKARGREFPDVANFVRYGIIEQRKKGEIGFSVQRCSNVIGTHEISFMGEYENIIIKHVAHSKEIFAKGAIKAAKWILKQKAGFYTMNDFTKEFMNPVFKEIYREIFIKR
ncbi:MAG: 4-hydroxy-tetrahydrodipicolinate reductase [Holosporales bacterium]|jgi:4-hydroxy-tetrahydrodipicolinate reductase|nr:4-hydroxy-tetrahydrodipicolinate reductase [Holosporales bacterium]